MQSCWKDFVRVAPGNCNSPHNLGNKGEADLDQPRVKVHLFLLWMVSVNSFNRKYLKQGKYWCNVCLDKILGSNNNRKQCVKPVSQ